MGVSNAIFSPSQARVYRWIFGQPDSGFHLNELRRLTGLGSASLQRELNRLEHAGLVSSERIGNLRRFRANARSPVFAELVALTRKTLGIEQALREALDALRPALHMAWLYGSVAKQSDTAQSDVDVMIVGENLALADVLKQLLPVEERIGRRINPTCYTPAEFERRLAEPDSFVNRVLSQPVVALIGETHGAGSAR